RMDSSSNIVVIKVNIYSLYYSFIPIQVDDSKSQFWSKELRLFGVVCVIIRRHRITKDYAIASQQRARGTSWKNIGIGL
ncbi:MAG: hypothetical protein EZS28_044832, partial [Streblomastix strix]